ncbi:c-type cytochrome [Marinobacterium mangrovicola]|uniref:Cytochrome c556 n=1 Tax=Marinobacterium mangrovicola TaxID=1476959 RepID=A0A4R1GFK7_9GAMM|nr:cytochrome c [Marinobacterium mangrovicola]TCK05630.1 cytochrome c556 [Marinobacterium mangrovicola]
MKKLVIATLSGALLAGSLNVYANDVEDAIEYRQGVFQAIKWYFGPMAGMAKGDIEYDAAEFTRRAEMLNQLSYMAEEGFIEGSAEGDTDALPAIWEDMDQFSAGFDKLQENTAALAEASKSGDMGTIMPAFAEVGKTCKGCHDNFRD